MARDATTEATVDTPTRHSALVAAAAAALGRDGHLLFCLGRPGRDDCDEPACLALRRALRDAWPEWPGRGSPDAQG